MELEPSEHNQILGINRLKRVHLSVSSPSRLPYTAYATEQARHGINGIRKVTL